MTRTNLGVVVFASASLLIAGCGSSSSPGVAHLSSGTSGGSAANTSGSSSTSESSASTQQKMVAYAQCMRAHGVPEFPEPTEGHLLIHSSDRNGQTTGVDPKSAQFQAAQKVCGKLLPEGGTLSPAQQAKVQESALKFSQCMRAHGVPNFPDPSFSGGGVKMTLKAGGATGIDPNSPQFKAAQKTCQSLRLGPRMALGGPAAPPPSGSGSGSEQSSSEAIVP
jgi:hypothetical protein